MDTRSVLVFVAGVCLALCSRAPTTQEWVEIINRCAAIDLGGLAVTVPVSSDCRLFAACSFPTLREPIIQHCAAGTYFDENSGGCQFAALTDCISRGASDPCSGLRDGYVEDLVRNEGDRAAFLMCRGGITVSSSICPQCHSFGNSETNCVPISNCVADPVTFPTICNHEAIADNPQEYIAIGVKTRDVLRCGEGTTYNAELCICT